MSLVRGDRNSVGYDEFDVPDDDDFIDESGESEASIDGKLLADRMSPLNVFLAGSGLWLAIFIFAPIDPRWPDTSWPIVLLLGGIVATALGIMFPTMLLGPVGETTHVTSNSAYKKVLQFCFLLSGIGIFAKFYDLFFVRNLNFSDNIDVARDRVSAAGASSVSMIAAGFLPFAIAVFCLAAVGTQVGYRKRIGLSAIATVLAAPTAGLLIGSRSGLLFVFLPILMMYGLFTKRIRTSHLLIIFAGIVAAALFFAAVFMIRAEAFGVDAQEMARYSAYTQVTPATKDYLDFIDSLGELRSAGIALTSLVQYQVSGVFEFFYLVDLKDDNFTNGAWTFFFVPKILALIFGGSAADTQAVTIAANPRAGVFQTFYGPLYIDFGIFFLVASFVWGVAVSFADRSARRGNLFAIPLLVFMLSIVLMMPTMSGLDAGAGIISVVTLSILAFFGGIYSSKMRLHQKARD